MCMPTRAAACGFNIAEDSGKWCIVHYCTRAIIDLKLRAPCRPEVLHGCLLFHVPHCTLTPHFQIIPHCTLTPHFHSIPHCILNSTPPLHSPLHAHSLHTSTPFPIAHSLHTSTPFPIAHSLHTSTPFPIARSLTPHLHSISHRMLTPHSHSILRCTLTPHFTLITPCGKQWRQLGTLGWGRPTWSTLSLTTMQPWWLPLHLAAALLPMQSQVRARVCMHLCFHVHTLRVAAALLLMQSQVRARVRACMCVCICAFTYTLCIWLLHCC